MRRLVMYLSALLASAFIAGCGGSDSDLSTIDQAAQQRGFTALLAAASKAGLAAPLADSSSQLTVFAPTNAAFNNLAIALGFADASAMVNALPATVLKDILSYHVLASRKTAADLIAGPAAQPTLYSFQGQPATVSFSASGGARLTDAVLTTANVTTADVGARNGIIHVVDKVLVPPGVLNVVQMAQLNPNLSSLVSAVVSANLQGSLAGPGPFTVFAPANAAFAEAPSGLTTQQLTTVLTYHVLGSQVLASQIPFGTPVATLSGQSIMINSGTPTTIADTTATLARITATDIRASNGVIHLIDKVLIPAL